MSRSLRRLGLVSTTSLISLLALTIGTAAISRAQDSGTPPAQGQDTLPPLVVNEPKKKPKPARPRQTTATRTNARRASRSTPPPAAQPASQVSDNLGIGNQGGNGPPLLEQIPGLGKTGTKLEDIPVSIQIIPRSVINQQGDTMLRQAITNASGVNEGGQDSLGYFDHFLIRGLNAQIYSDGFSDGDQLGGVSHSLNGVKQIEVLEGPGSALFGSGPPGGTINLLHYQPSPVFHYGASLQAGSWGTVTNQDYVTGPTAITGLNYRIDATASRADGFRDLASNDAEIRPDFTWTINDHLFEVSLDARQLKQTPDSYGLIYFQGAPIQGVPNTAKYSTPFAHADQDFLRPVVSDKWFVSDFLTVNNRFAYTHRNLDVLRNGDSTSTTVNSLDQVVGRQLREQSDLDNTYDYQLEPVWKFGTGPIGHTLLTGFEAVRQTMATARQTADLPNIANAFAPVPTEASVNGLQFQCDAKHSCDNDRLYATYLSAYATDQIDVTDRWKIRAGVRQDWWDTTLDPLITVPGRFTSSGVPIIGGVAQEAQEKPVSWNAGTLYHLLPGVSPYFGVSRSYLTNFNSENTQQGIGAPETALQYEVGIKFAFFDDRIVLNTAAFDVKRENVAAAVTLNGIETVVYDSQRTKGVEASLDGRVTDQWHILANATAQNAVITDNPQGITSIGNHPQGVPAYMANLWSTYNFSIAGIPGFQVGAGLNYRDKTYSDITNLNSIPGYVIANAELSYETPTWGASLNVKNFTNQNYYVAANAAGAFVGDPLSVFLTVYVKH
jgi:iron complex outermembrane recepter protein